MKSLGSIKTKSITAILFKNIPLFITFIISYSLFFVLFIQTIQYSRLNLAIYSFIFIFLLIVILILSVLAFEGVYENKRKLQRTALVGFVILTLIFSVLTYLVVRINSSVGNVIVDQNQETVVDLAFVTYNNSKLETIDDIANKKLGILSNSDALDRNSAVKSEIEENSINIQYVEYLSYNELMLGLFAGDIDVATLPSDYVNQFEGSEGYQEYLDKTLIIHEFSIKVESTIEQSDIDVTKDPFTILIMGNEDSRTDSMILATYNPIKLSVTMTSIPRDSYVPIACYPNQQKDKLGHASVGGRDCAIQTVENLLDVKIDYYVVVNFQGVVEIVDALEGIWVESPIEFVGQDSSEERGHYTVWIPKGGFWATGEQALTFARERHLMPGGDYQRQVNQQNVIASIIDRTLTLNDVNKALNVLDAAGSNIETNLPLSQMIEIFNGLIKAMNRTNVIPEFIIDITGSQVTGYSSYTYNEPLELPLWIVVPYKGSIEDMKTLINSNLTETTVLPESVEMQFNAASVFFQPDYFALTYNEKEVHEVLPDFMPNMTNNSWTLSRVNEWANARGINIVVDKIKPGTDGYVSSVEHNYIVGQSVRYGVKTSKITTLTVKAIKHDLDCKIDANMVYDECKYKLPNFVLDLTKLSEVVKWATANNITLKYITIPETDATYDKTKLGLIIKQSPETLEDIRTISELTITVMDSNYSVTIPDTTSWNLTSAQNWVAANLIDPANYSVVYIPTTDSSKVGLVSSTVPSSGSKIKVKEALLLNVYGEGFVLDNYVGKTESEVRTALCTPGIVQCVFTTITTTDATLVNKVESQSTPSGTLKLKTEWATSSISFKLYALAPTTPSTTTP